MTRDETIKLLAILKAAYPSAFRNLTRIEGEAMVGLWSSEFAPYPSDIVTAAVRRIIKKSRFLPSISETLRETWCVAVDMRADMLCSAALGRDVPRAELERVSAVVSRLDAVRASGAKAFGEGRSEPALPA